ncbi:MAG: two-component sensor histidine kinase [Planctomycetaceae bacterium]|nr:two-component sensor histidine kinase [Planctomycetaceae bacterium]
MPPRIWPRVRKEPVMGWWWIIVAAVLGLAAGSGLTLWLARRTWHGARRLAARTKGHDHLVELGQLAGGLAHEIKNPLSTINVNLQLLAEDLSRRGSEDDIRLFRRLKNVQGEADRLRSILDDFLQYAGKLELHLSPTDVRQVVDELTDFFAPQAETARVILRTPHPGEPVICDIDVNLLKQSLLNLMINAIQAMPNGGELILRVEAQKNRAVIEVIDTGPGIPPETLSRIFDVYYSTKKHGTGLGLPTARRIIRAHGGSIRVDSEPGKGTRFVISLPLTAPTKT